MKETSWQTCMSKKMNQFDLSDELIIKREKVEEDEDCNNSDNIPVSSFARRAVAPPPLSRRFAAFTKPCIQLGQTFNSFAEVASAINKYETTNNVHLNQKYFRRIAANPKPSNKEDYSLTEEERKRFVYRWVDFCCTYFDEMLARADPEDTDANGTKQALGFAMKECPMRIRFQLRFKEKDLMISIFREAHDHSYPSTDPSQLSSLPKISNDSPIATTDPLKDVVNDKRQRPPPPPLAPLVPSKLPKESPSVLQSTRHRPVVAPGIRNSRPPLPSHTTLPIPKPPPLKAMPSLSCNAAELRNVPANGHVSGLSAEDVIRNVYHHLSSMLTQPSIENGLRFTSPNPDLLKITSKLTGVDTGRILSICPKTKLRYAGSARNTSKPGVATPAILQSSSSSVLSTSPNAILARRDRHTTPNSSFSDSDISVPLFKPNPRIRNPLSEDTEPSFVNMPVEVIIKSEPDEHIDFYNENDDSNNSHNLSTNEEYFDSQLQSETEEPS